jgi:L-seryl-tRNA(Ser) seleniumtransferase
VASDPRRQVPRTDALLGDARLAVALDTYGRPAVKRAVVAAQQQVRDARLAADEVPDAVLRALADGRSGAPQRVFNATGVVVHTNLGRAPLSDAAIDALSAAARHTDVEFDLVTGARALRGRGMLDALAGALPDAGAVFVVNNGAAAVVLATTALAAGREVIVSRGELVEIGDGFRLPELIESTGARLREVGTTNRVRLEDYARAVGPQTGAVLKVHPSNFRVEGFTSAVEVRELATLPVPVIADIGSGLLAPHPLLPDEPDMATALRAGAAIVTCSGDKLLGGPQAGVVAGRADVIEQVRRHPLARAVRIDKLTVAALAASLDPARSPVWQALTADPDALRARSAALVDALAADGITAAVVAADGAVGGGGGPGVRLPGWAVSLPAAYAVPLRTGRPPVVGRVAQDRCLLDLRCVPPADDPILRRAVLDAALSAGSGTVGGRGPADVG